jgi:ABC-type sugar transport system permease subunit
MALVLNQSFRGRSFVRAVILLPWAIPTVVNARMWEWIYAGSSFGALNGLMKVARVFPQGYDQVWLSFDVPFKTVPLLGSFLEWLGVTQALDMIILADTWKVTPLVTLLVLAGLQTIPESLYEAARVDGAGPWRRFVQITLPLLKPVLLVVLVLRTMELFRVFDIIYILMQYSIRTLGVYTYEVGMKFLHFGQGAALSFLVGLFILGLALAYVRILYREEGY